VAQDSYPAADKDGPDIGPKLMDYWKTDETAAEFELGFG
jgi:hypothetical protein